MRFINLLPSILCLWIFLSEAEFIVQPPSFKVDESTATFLKDGLPFRYVGGCYHYFRSTKDMWRDIMMKMKEGGLNVLQTYVEWSSHEPEPGVYDFKDNLDVVSFIKLADEVGLLVILRPGPYICAERDFGGLPYWLLREKPDIVLRSTDAVYVKYVNQWFDVLLPMMRPLLYENGGPIIMVQIENEYGQYNKCDHAYMSHLRDLNRKHLGDKVVLFRTNLPTRENYQCDKVDGVMASADFGPGTNVEKAFEILREASPRHPATVSEFYIGWMDHWSEPHATVKTDEIAKTLNDILNNNGSVCFYMYYGGTNFALSNGANAPNYTVQPTSYDYAAPISEDGDLSHIYYRIRDTIGMHFPIESIPKRKPSVTTWTGPVKLHATSTLMKYISTQKDVQLFESDYPKSFEALSVRSGFVSYATKVKFVPEDPSVLQVPGLRDRGLVFVDNEMVGIVSRREKVFFLALTVRIEQVITIVVENQGRINFGWEIHDPKGLIENVTLNGQLLRNWTMIPVPLSDIIEIQQLSAKSSETYGFQPKFYSGKFVLPKNTQKGASTFLDPSGFYRGIAFLNGFNLGRYWPIAGPQVTLFVPAVVLKPHPEENVLTLLELEKTPCLGPTNKCYVKFVKNSILDGPVPSYSPKTIYVNFSELYNESDSVPSFTIETSCLFILTLLTIFICLSCLK